ncbi:MAG: ATP-binding protein [Cytophagales bacterium]|nr:MAG: ATP-binding protein [Cytophagales bacterium]TAH27862.1 MAG: ATP-binding protein [Cytophagales bacterium]
METLKIEFPSTIENINLVENFITEAKEKFHISEMMYGNIMVAVTESVNNAIIHGNHQDENKKVFLSFAIDKNKLAATVIDEGNGFDFEHLPDPTAPENINKIGGRGVFLIKNLSDKVLFHDGGKVVEMHFSLQ